MLGKRIAYSDFANIHMMKSICEEAGVFIYEVQFSSHVSFAGADMGIYLEVPDEFMSQAIELLSSTKFSKFLIEGN